MILLKGDFLEVCTKSQRLGATTLAIGQNLNKGVADEPGGLH